MTVEMLNILHLKGVRIEQSNLKSFISEESNQYVLDMLLNGEHAFVRDGKFINVEEFECMD